MGRLTWTRTTTAGALGALTLALALAGCSPDQEPAPSPTTVAETTEAPSPTPTPTETPSPTAEPTPELTVEQQHVAEAEQTIRDYHAAADEVGAEGFGTWTEKLYMFWGSPEVYEPTSAAFQASADQGRRTEGTTVIAAFTLLQYVPDPTQAGGEQVQLEYCADYSDLSTFAQDGSLIERTSPTRLTWEALLQHQPSGNWSMIKLAAKAEIPC